jgi:hypothetical protein
MQLNRALRNLLAATAIAAAAFVAAPATHAQVSVGITAGYAPPQIPDYEQPECPGDGYIWTPGYWAWGDGGYYWVDGAWVLPPYTAALWTPGYWGWGDGLYAWSPGYWGLNVGFYGGINYGFGYFGSGFYGGYWNGGRFWYNREYGHFGEGFRGGFYDRHYDGFNGRPGGVAYSHAEFNGNHGGGYRGSSINGGNHSGPRDNFGGARPMVGNFNGGHR